MRTVLSTALLLIVGAIAANAEPPPQAVAVSSAVTVADQRANALPAVMVTQADTAQVAASSTARVDTVSDSTRARDGHGMGFWAVIAVVGLAVVFFAWRYFTRDPAAAEVPTSRAESDEPRTRPPGSSGRRFD